MKKSVLHAAVLMMILHLEVNGITPVLVGEFEVDLSQYTTPKISFGRPIYCPGPAVSYADERTDGLGAGMFVQAFLKKNSNQFDFYSYTGKIGTSVIPGINDPNLIIHFISFSRTMLDEDSNWESIVQYRLDTTDLICSKVFDDDGTELLSDISRLNYGIDGKNTYVVSDYNSNYGKYSLKAWRFRTNIASAYPLAKSQATSPGLMTIYGQDNGNYRVTLSPSSGNQVNFQMFDLLGRCIFSKQINNITSTQTFTIPESNVPNTPFIAKVKDKKEVVYKKQIPVR